MANIWQAFDDSVDSKKLNEEVASCKTNNDDFEDLPNGKYEVSLDSLELKQSKAKHYPMLTAMFTVLDGKYKKRKIFMNQVVYMGDENDKYRMNTANKFLSSLDSGLPIVFEKMSKYAVLIEDVFNAVKANGYEYLLELGKNKGGYTTYAIKEVYSAE